MDIENKFTDQNKAVNLDDANGRAFWALGYLISAKEFLPERINSLAISIIQKAMSRVHEIHSTRAMAFAIKGLFLL